MNYLACSYSHPDPKVREQRFHDVTKLAAKLMSKGILIYSPITESHPLVAHGLETGWDFWKKRDEEFIEFCKELWIFDAEGWESSIGVNAEIKIAKRLNKSIRMIDAMGYLYPFEEQKNEN